MVAKGIENISKKILCSSNAEIATICVHIFIFPSCFAATTSPSSAKIKRSPVTANSRLIIKMTIHEVQILAQLKY